MGATMKLTTNKPCEELERIQLELAKTMLAEQQQKLLKATREAEKAELDRQLAALALDHALRQVHPPRKVGEQS
jgi:hypothetical protein